MIKCQNIFENKYFKQRVGMNLSVEQKTTIFLNGIEWHRNWISASRCAAEEVLNL